jgi:hypothetical protein
MIRITVQESITDKELTASMTKFLQRLKAKLGGAEFFLVNEWSDGRRHHHVLIRTAGRLTRRLVRTLWKRCCRGRRFTYYCRKINKTPDAVARYVVKDVRDDSKKELPPKDFRGKVYSYSDGFFSAPVKDLWRDQLAEWYPDKTKEEDPASGTSPQTEHPLAKQPRPDPTGASRARPSDFADQDSAGNPDDGRVAATLPTASVPAKNRAPGFQSEGNGSPDRAAEGNDHVQRHQLDDHPACGKARRQGRERQVSPRLPPGTG